MYFWFADSLFDFFLLCSYVAYLLNKLVCMLLPEFAEVDELFIRQTLIRIKTQLLTEPHETLTCFFPYVNKVHCLFVRFVFISLLCIA